MLLGRMAYRLSLLCLTPWMILPAIAAVATTNIRPEVLNFVPTCAQNCFESFISANFDAGICGNSPSLECLCRQQGSSGYTVGEGAVSCLAGESRFGACQGQDGINDAIATAYNMCVGISKAEPMTHSTIVATLVIPSGTGPLLVPTAISTATSKASATTAPTPTSTVSLPTGTGAPGSTTPTSSTTVVSPTATATESPASSESQPQLGSAQIAGITLGCVAVVVFGILLVLLARCVRRRRFGDLEAGFSKMRDSMSFGRKSRPNSAPGIQISSPIPRVQAKRDPMDPRWQPQIPVMYQQGVGLAFSPSAARGGVSAKPSPVPASTAGPPLPPVPAPGPGPAPSPAPAPAGAAQSVPRLILSPPPAAQPPRAERSPPKPTLTLAIPKAPEQVVRVPTSGRDSVVTEFAEDGEAELAPGTTIWRPPATDPLSATTIYFADKGGNWILRNTSTRRPEMPTSKMARAPTRPPIKEGPQARGEIELPSPEHKTKAERAKDAYGEFSPDALVSPLRLPRRPGQARLGSPITFKDQRREPQLSSPSLSERLSQTAETLGRGPAQTANRPPNMLSSPRDLTGGRIKRRPSRRASRRVSQESATSIESAAAGPFENGNAVVEDESQLDLSPVAESPHTPISPGKSPVTYPNIRKQNDIQQLPVSTMRPEVPGAPRYNVWHPPGYASPTGASVLPSINSVKGGAPRVKSPERPPQNALGPRQAPTRNTGQPRTRPPGTGTGPAPVSPIEKQYWQRQRQVANPASYWNQPPRNPPAKVRAAARPRQPPPPTTPPYELPTSENSPRRLAMQTQTQTPPQSQDQQRRPAPTTTRPTGLPTPQATPASAGGGGDASSSSSQSQQQQQSTLLAKRRGADKAAALSLAANTGKGKGGGDTTQRARRPGWTKEQPSGYGPAPITPGWVPELTPTRRGEDLYLNVR
ncbi:uncharacterized protein B0T15DRAFT_126797 [Chaetomium strumarium]|uniref:Extracellular membrane protein CFEM domain-containing protein n=1 Tax=Chaetomium strumarium TaxID=1170767 RepID=A0AAJ0GZI7_9PEZI|nr:hypothetical protein B0T15DRAFT_126797 [Chaetomium strumarium]